VLLQGRFSATARKLGIEYAQGFWGWSKYGPKIKGIVVTLGEAARIREDIAPRKAKNATARKSRSDAIKAEADAIGVLKGSRTWRAYRAGEIDADEAARIGRITTARHEATDYDALLASGVDRETARELIREQMNAALTTR
jgi:hypothetical protein